MSGLTLSDSEEDLAILYLATIQALAVRNIYAKMQIADNNCIYFWVFAIYLYINLAVWQSPHYA